MKQQRVVNLNKWKREWFYFIDHKGMLFLEETEPKNYTSCLKDDNFLVSTFLSVSTFRISSLETYGKTLLTLLKATNMCLLAGAK